MFLEKINSPQDLKKLDIDNLKKLAQEIRELIIEVVSKNGGHLASNLGTVELTLALHYCFNTPFDKIIWDVGHQAYTHKIITGRKNLFSSLRQYKGISGFPRTKESEYDIFDTGHASCSISQALGLAIGRDLSKENYKIVAIIGDGALISGLALEALNHAGQLQKDIIVVLNTNEMAISENVGALAKYLNRLITEPVYIKTKQNIEKILLKFGDIGTQSLNLLHRFTESIKNILLKGGILFEELGFKYIGPIDGHDINLLVDTFNRVKEVKSPVLINIYTKKGKGYKPAEKYPELFHSAAAFDIKTGKPKTHIQPTYSQIIGDYIVKLAEENPKVVGITAAMAHGTGLYKLKERFKDRFFDVGIAEEHAVVLATGMAKTGLVPIVCIYSTFLQRAYDQILHDVALQNLHVIFAIDRAGIVGEDGHTHQGIFDIAYLRHIPNMVIMAAGDARELWYMLKFALYELNCPVAIRYPKGSPQIDLNIDDKIELGKGCEIKGYGRDLNILAIGSTLANALLAVEELSGEFDIGLYNARFIKPLDKKLIFKLIKKPLLIIEEHIITCGFGSAILELLNKENINYNSIKILALPEQFIEHGSSDILLKINNLDKEGIKSAILKLLATQRVRETRVI